MKKMLLLLGLVALAGCAAETPTAIRPYVGGPVYYKQPKCEIRQTYPKVVNRWNYNVGMNESYVTYENVYEQVCNYNPVSLYGMYGTM